MRSRQPYSKFNSEKVYTPGSMMLNDSGIYEHQNNTNFNESDTV